MECDTLHTYHTQNLTVRSRVLYRFEKTDLLSIERDGPLDGGQIWDRMSIRKGHRTPSTVYEKTQKETTIRENYSTIFYMRNEREHIYEKN